MRSWVTWFSLLVVICLLCFLTTVRDVIAIADLIVGIGVVAVAARLVIVAMLTTIALLAHALLVVALVVVCTHVVVVMNLHLFAVVASAASKVWTSPIRHHYRCASGLCPSRVDARSDGVRCQSSGSCCARVLVAPGSSSSTAAGCAVMCNSGTLPLRFSPHS